MEINVHLNYIDNVFYLDEILAHSAPKSCKFFLLNQVDQVLFMSHSKYPELIQK